MEKSIDFINFVCYNVQVNKSVMFQSFMIEMVGGGLHFITF